MPISKFSTLTELKDYVRKNKLNKGDIRLNMKKSVMLGLLDKGGHIHTGARGADAPKKKATPKKATPKKDVDKDLFMNAMSVMTDVAKSKNKKTKKDVDKDVVLSKKKSISFNELYDILLDDDDYMDEEYERRDNIQEGYNMEYFIHQKLKLPNKDDYEELTDKQQDKLMALYEKESKKDIQEYAKTVWKEHIKGKKFNTVKSLIKKFMDNF